MRKNAKTIKEFKLELIKEAYESLGRTQKCLIRGMMVSFFVIASASPMQLQASYYPISVIKTSASMMAETEELAESAGTIAHMGLMQRWEDELEEIAALPENYDGDGAWRVEQGCLRSARKVLQDTAGYLRWLTDISPMPFGTVCMEWTLPGGFLSMDIDGAKLNFYLDREGKETKFFPTSPIVPEGITALKKALSEASELS